GWRLSEAASNVNVSTIFGSAENATAANQPQLVINYEKQRFAHARGVPPPAPSSARTRQQGRGHRARRARVSLLGAVPPAAVTRRPRRLRPRLRSEHGAPLSHLRSRAGGEAAELPRRPDDRLPRPLGTCDAV